MCSVPLQRSLAVFRAIAAGKTVRFRLLRASIERAATAQVTRGHTLLDGARGHLAAAVRSRGRHLVAGHHGDRDGGRRAAVLQRAAAAGHAPHPRHAAAQAQEHAPGE